MDSSMTDNFLQNVMKRFAYYKELGDKTLEQIKDETLYFVEPVPGSNSIALIVQHLHGNMLSRWTHFLTEDGEKDWRKRDAEFEPTITNKVDLLLLWNEGWNCMFNTLQSLTATDLTKTITIRTEPLLVYDAILRQLAHYPYHVGQMVYLGKYFLQNNWLSLSIPKGDSQTYLAKIKEAQSLK
jgi:Protein of unknown function (DUF1572)